MPGNQLNDLERSKFYTDDNGLVYVRTYPNGSEVDTSNSTNTPLGVDGTYTGDPIDILGFGNSIGIMMINTLSQQLQGKPSQFSQAINISVSDMLMVVWHRQSLDLM
jgi:hypothetical protein